MEYIVHYQMCDECHRREAKDFWRAVVQVRQKVGGDNCQAVKDYAMMMSLFFTDSTQEDIFLPGAADIEVPRPQPRPPYQGVT